MTRHRSRALAGSGAPGGSPTSSADGSFSGSRAQPRHRAKALLFSDLAATCPAVQAMPARRCRLFVEAFGTACSTAQTTHPHPTPQTPFGLKRIGRIAQSSGFTDRPFCLKPWGTINGFTDHPFWLNDWPSGTFRPGGRGT